MEYTIALLQGDGIGPEVTHEATRVLNAIGLRYNHTFVFNEGLVGGAAIDATGNPLPEETLEIVGNSDAILFGAVGGPKWDDPRASTRPEAGLLGLRRAMGLFANLRPVKVVPDLLGASPIKMSIIEKVDLIVVRELTGGLYFAEPKRMWDTSRGRRAVDTLKYSEQEIRRVLQVGFDLARTRRKRLTSVDKANVLASSRLWREVAQEMAEANPDITVNHVLVDACAMMLIQRPGDFDVIVTENMFGDILTDEASVIAGSMGMLPSASVGKRRNRRRGGGLFGMYEPIHGSAPDIAGRFIANPLAAISSAAMLLRISLGLTDEAEAIEAAVDATLASGFRTADLAGSGPPDSDVHMVNTMEMTNEVIQRIESPARARVPRPL